MDPVMSEAVGMLGADLEIVTNAPSDANRVLLPRWDWSVRRNLGVFVPVRQSRWIVPRVARLCVRRLRHPDWMPRPFEIQSIRKSIESLKDVLIPKALETGIDRGFSGKFLVLKRSEPPAFYREGGEARTKSYGTTRRALAGVDEAVAELKRLGLPVAVFEPGKESLATQIRAFHEASGIVAIRGAELANMIWMNPGARAVMLAPRAMQKQNRMPTLIAQIAKIDLVEIEVDTEFPVLDGPSILPFLSEDRSAA